MASLAPWSAGRRVAVAVSGGADSMALAWLTRQWGAPLALVVDHGLRGESGAEAALTRDRLAALGIPARILTIDGLAPGPALAARARAARYAALETACFEAGLTDLLIGHHRRDQAETVLMREAAGSRGDGLAGMAAIAWRGHVRLVRPLLEVPPGRLRMVLREAGIQWVEDPSNADMRSLRARLRAELDDAFGDGEAVARIAASARTDGAARARRESAFATFLALHASVHEEGFARLDAGQAPDGALSALIRCVGGLAHPPAPDAVAAVASRLRPATLGGVRILPAGRLGRGWLVVREPAAVAAPEPARDGLLWDGRFRLCGAVAPGLTVGALGDAAARLRDVSPLPSAVLRGLPALRRDGVLVAVPVLAYPAPQAMPRMRFIPRTPLAGLPFWPSVAPAAGCSADGDAEA